MIDAIVPVNTGTVVAVVVATTRVVVGAGLGSVDDVEVTGGSVVSGGADVEDAGAAFTEADDPQPAIATSITTTSAACDR